MSAGRCAVALFAAPGGDRLGWMDACERAWTRGQGDLQAIAVLPGEAAFGARALADAAERAASEGCDWLLCGTDDEPLLPAAFEVIAPALRIHDVVWGAAARLDGAGTPRVERITRLAAQSRPEFFHAALAWWIGRTHIVRPRTALDALAGGHGDVMPGWYARYMMALWRNASAYKTAQPLTVLLGASAGLHVAELASLVASLADEPAFMTVRHGAASVRIPYTGLNPVIEREQMRGVFFEADELDFLAERLGRGLRIVDAGANTGNHTLFFAAVMQADAVFPIEPVARAADAIRAAVTAGGLHNVRPDHLGVAVGASSARMRAAPANHAGLGATRLIPDPDGPIRVEALDSLFDAEAGKPIGLLKIDVEGMELAVLAGGEGLIARERPAIFVEVLDTAIREFLAWVDARSYRIEKLFPDKAHCNYLLIPSEMSGRRP